VVSPTIPKGPWGPPTKRPLSLLSEEPNQIRELLELAHLSSHGLTWGQVSHRELRATSMPKYRWALEACLLKGLQSLLTPNIKTSGPSPMIISDPGLEYYIMVDSTLDPPFLLRHITACPRQMTSPNILGEYLPKSQAQRISSERTVHLY
jgi:hypothetical protein